MSAFSERLEEALKMRNMSPAELSRAAGIGEGAISQYRKGLCKAAQKNLEKIANALNVPIPWLMGLIDDLDPRLANAKMNLREHVKLHPDTPSGERLSHLRQAAGFLDEYFGYSLEIPEEYEEAYGRWIGYYQLPVRAVVDIVLKGLNMRPEELLNFEELRCYQYPFYPGNLTFLSNDDTKEQEEFLESDPIPAGVHRPAPMGRAPLLGRIACGEPILAEENIEDYVDLPKHITADFALECRGDSMIGAGIQDGDVVYIRQQPEVENGQIAAVLVGDEEATLKRFYFDGQAIQLVAENPKFAPMVFTGEDINKVRVIGRAVAFTHSLA